MHQPWRYGWIILVLFGVSLPCKSSGQERTEALSVEETLGAAVTKYEDLPMQPLHSRANPGAKEGLYKLLSNAEYGMYQTNALRMIGYIGDEGDAEKLARMLKAYSGALTGAQENSLTATLAALGLMARRGVARAESELVAASKYEYWKGRKIVLYPPEVMEKHPEYKYNPLKKAIWAYGEEGGKDIGPLVEAALKGIDDPKDRQYVGGINPKTVADAHARLKKAELLPLTDAQRRGLISSWKERSAAFASNGGKLTPEESAFVRKTTQEALVEYEAMKAAVISEKYEDLKGRLLDNGRLRETTDRLWVEHSKDLAREKQVFDLLAEHGCKPGDFRVDRTSSYEFASLPKDGDVAASKTEGFSVSFHMKDSQEIGNLLFSRQKGTTPTVDQDGMLIVLMRKIDGKWYWNPFGW